MVEYMLFKPRRKEVPRPDFPVRSPLPPFAIATLPPAIREYAKRIGPGAKLTYEEEFGDFFILKYEGLYAIRRPGGATDFPTAILTHEVWAKKDGSYACILAPKYAAMGISVMVSLGMYGAPDILLPWSVSRQEYLRFIDWVKRQTGHVNRITLRGEGAARYMEILGSHLEDLDYFGRLLDEMAIQKVGFRVDYLNWTLAEWGGGQLLSPVWPAKEDLFRLLCYIEEARGGPDAREPSDEREEGGEADDERG